MEIPKTIRYDVLLLLLGISLVIYPFYLNKIGISENGLVIILTSGMILIVFSIGYIKNEYDLDSDLKETQYVKSKYELIKDLEKKELLTNTQRNKLIKALKDIVNKR